jgi:hypothetical protein
MNTVTARNDISLVPTGHDEGTAVSGPSFGAALCGFVSTTVATTMVMFLLNSI